MQGKTEKMCLAYRINHKSVSPVGARSFFVPCGKCEECRKVVKNSWAFRLRAELEDCIKNKFNTMFFTLTYKDEKLPRLGFDCFSDDYKQILYSLQTNKNPTQGDIDELKKIYKVAALPCFSREHIEKFIHSLREWLWRDYGIKSVSYFVAAEFGSHTRRPHYHGLLSLPPQIDPRLVFEFICKHWHPFGHVFPRYFEGGRDSHGYSHKSFVVQSPMASARYCAKYATKDLYYDEFLLNNGLTDKVVNIKSREFKRKMVFHIQKKSLGACVLRGLDDRQKLDLYTIGHAFVDDDKMSRIPVYIKNKLIYDNYYVYEPATIAHAKGDKELGEIALAETYYFKRLVRRKANKFFHDNVKQIYAHKVKTYTEFFKNFLDKSLYEKRKISPEFISYGVNLMGWISSQTSFEELAEYYLLYDGVPLTQWFYVPKEDRHLLYLLRYTQSFNDCDFDRFTSFRVQTLLDALDMVIHCFYINPLSITEAKKLEDRIADFFKSNS